MSVHPLRAVGVLPEVLPDGCVAIPLHGEMDHEPVINAEGLPNDPLHTSLTTSIVSSAGSSTEANPFEQSQQRGDDILDNMIARFFESDAEGLRGEVDMVSVDEITFNTTSQEETKKILMEEIDIALSTSCSAPHRDVERRKGATSWDQTQGRRKRAIKKGKRSRAPARPWTEEEHQRFEESLELFGRNWEQCAAYIGTRRAQLVRSHAQKHLIKLWKLGKPLPKKVAESGTGYTLSGKPLLADSASARSYLTKIPCPDIL